MITFVFALGIVALSIGGLAIGLALGRTPIKGTCGGLNCVKDADCAACTNRGRLETRP